MIFWAEENYVNVLCNILIGILQISGIPSHYTMANISANDPDPGSGSKGIDPVFLLFSLRVVV